MDEDVEQNVDDAPVNEPEAGSEPGVDASGPGKAPDHAADLDPEFMQASATEEKRIKLLYVFSGPEDRPDGLPRVAAGI